MGEKVHTTRQYGHGVHWTAESEEELLADMHLFVWGRGWHDDVDYTILITENGETGNAEE